MGKYSNISVSRYKKVLKQLGLKHVRTNSGHEMWYKEGMPRNVVFQTHIEPIPEFIVIKNMETIGVSKKEFEEALRQS